MLSPLVGASDKEPNHPLPRGWAGQCGGLLDFTSYGSTLSTNAQVSREDAAPRTCAALGRNTKSTDNGHTNPSLIITPPSEVTKLLRALWMEVSAANSNKNRDTKGGKGAKMSVFDTPGWMDVSVKWKNAGIVSFFPLVGHCSVLNLDLDRKMP